MPSERKLNVSLSMKIKGESTSVKVLPWDPFATFNVTVLIHSVVHIGCAFGATILFLYSFCSCYWHDTNLLFISFTKPSMTTLPSSSSKVKSCFLFE